MITQDEVRRLFSYNRHTGILKWRNPPANKPSGEAGSFNTNGHLQVRVNGKLYLVHVLIWLGIYGYISEGDIDHIDKIKHHNWLSNLREVSHICNIRNTGNFSHNKSGVKGVSFFKNTNKWRAGITVNNKQIHIGLFKDFDEAVCHRLAMEQCLNWSNCDSNSPAYKYVRENIQSM